MALRCPGCCMCSGSKAVEFPNGTRKTSHPDGRVSICFSNGDVKLQRPEEGRVDYFYREVRPRYLSCTLLCVADDWVKMALCASVQTFMCEVSSLA